MTRSWVLRVAAVMTYATAVGAGQANAQEWTNLDRDAAQFRTEMDLHLSKARELLDQVLAVAGPRTMENTLVPANEMRIHLDKVFQQSELFAQVHPEREVRDAADVAMQKVSRFLTDLLLNRELYEVFTALNVSGADSDTRRLMFKTLRGFQHAGVDRDEATRAKVKSLEEALVELAQRFSNNIRDDVRHITLNSPEELAGLPDDYVKTHSPGEDGKITITTDYPDAIPFMKYARNADARLRLHKAFRTRGHPDNIAILDGILAKRYELARTLGYDNYAAYVTEDKMIKTATAVDDFINRIAQMAAEPATRDMALLLEEKRRDDSKATAVGADERSYYTERVKAAKYDFDSQEARPFFEFSRVRQGLFDVTSRLFGVQYRPVKNVKLWHSDVSAWDLYEGDRHIGRFMLDLHPREGKYKHAACFGYQNGIRNRQIPINVLVCNFPNPKASAEPALMEHSQVVTFFHEFGHLLHSLFAGHHDWIDISGISTEWDFVEAPSQMLEEWTWDAETLRIFAKHYETDRPIPNDLVRRMRAARDFGKGVNVRQQMFYAAVSLNFHNRDPATLDTTQLLRELTRAYAPCAYVPDTYMHCSFGHLTGYSAIYYTYMWSLVIAKDMFSEFDKVGLFDDEVARRYRRAVLEPGGGAEASRLVRDFLGRDYGFEAYGRWLNAEGTPPS